MVTAEFIVPCIYTALLWLITIGLSILFVYGLCIRDFNAVWAFLGVIFLGAVSVWCTADCKRTYYNGTPQRQYELQKQKIIDAEREFQKWLIDHPEFKEKL